MFDETPIWIPLYLEVPYRRDVILPIYFSSSSPVSELVIFMSTYFLHHCLHKLYPGRLTGCFLEGEGVIYSFYV